MKLNITTQIKSDNPVNVYRLRVKIMHGDADFFSVKLEHYSPYSRKGMECLEKLITLLQRWFIYHNREEARRGTMASFVATVFPDDQHIVREFEDLIGLDLFCKDFGFYARPQEFQVTYFDENGQEFNVEIAE